MITVLGQMEGFRPLVCMLGPGKSIFLRHILFKHQQLRVMDPAARREGTCRGPGEAEAQALQVLLRASDAPFFMVFLLFFNDFQ